MEKTFKHNGEQMQVEISTYGNGGDKVIIVDGDGFPYASLGKPSLPRIEGSLVLDDAEHNMPVIKSMISAGIIGEMTSFIPSGYKDYGVYPLLAK